MKHVKLFEQFINEAKITKGSDVVKIMSNPQEWGSDMKDRVFTKGKNFIFADTFFYNEKEALDKLVQSWSPGGHYYDYFKDDYGIEVEIVGAFSDFKAKGRFKKLTNDGVVYIELAIKDVNESLSIGHAEVIRAEKNLPANQKELLAKEIKSGKIKTSQDLKDWLANIDESYEDFINEKRVKIKSASDIKKVYKKDPDTMFFANGVFYAYTGYDLFFTDQDGEEYELSLDDIEFADLRESSDHVLTEERMISDKDIVDIWKDIYGENFINEYPAVWKILKQRPPVDKREFKRIWDEAYGEDLEKEYEEFWKKIKS